MLHIQEKHFLTKTKNMTKNILTLLITLFSLTASAQFMVTSMLSEPADGEEMSLDNLTDNIGVMYSMDKISLGVMMNGEDYDLVARYAFGDKLFAYGLVTTEEENVSLGVGYALNVWNELYIEPSYLIDLENEDQEGELKFSLTYKF
tara:strand:- start:1152 stop:1592 length:441 start_codon:yes stop_codon:yes gene_type:complete